MTNCHIDFENNPMKIVYSGQTIRGTVQLNLTDEINIRGIYIHLYGGAYVNWRERMNCFKIHIGNEDYLNHRIYLIGATHGIVFIYQDFVIDIKWNGFGFYYQCLSKFILNINLCFELTGHIRLAPGLYNYAFECKLQSDVPTSFESENGSYIRYTALVVLDYQNSKEKTFTESFTVIREINLNNNPELRVSFD